MSTMTCWGPGGPRDAGADDGAVVPDAGQPDALAFNPAVEWVCDSATDTLALHHFNRMPIGEADSPCGVDLDVGGAPSLMPSGVANFGMAVEIDGSDSLDRRFLNASPITGDFTLEAYVSTSATAGVRTIAGLFNAGNNQAQIQLQINELGRVVGTICQEGSGAISATSDRSLTTAWTHVRLVHDGASLAIWLDGVLDATIPSSTICTVAANTDLFVGVDATDTEQFAGAIDALRLSSVVRLFD